MILPNGSDNNVQGGELETELLQTISSEVQWLTKSNDLVRIR